MNWHLPLEQLVFVKLLRKKSAILLIVIAAELVFFSLASLAGMAFDYSLFFHQYFPAIFLGVVALNGDIYALLTISRKIREGLPGMLELLPAKMRQNSSMLLYRLVYSRKRLLLFVVGTMVPGVMTFIVLGLRAPSRTILILTWGAIVLAFALLGALIAVGIGFWIWMHNFGLLQPHVVVYHHDHLGGLQPIGDLAGWITNMGAILVVIYSAGAYYSPYAHVELRRYSYSWVVMAAVLLVASFFTPSYTIHRCLLAAKKNASAKLTEAYHRLYESGEELEDSTSRKLEKELALLSHQQQSIDKLKLWPYTQLPTRILVVVATQAVPVVLEWYFFHH